MPRPLPSEMCQALIHYLQKENQGATLLISTQKSISPANANMAPISSAISGTFQQNYK